MNDLNTTSKTPGWQKKKILNAIVISILVVIALIAAGYTFQWDWTGLTSSYKVTTTTEVTKTPERKEITTLEAQPAKTLWDWLQLLGILAIPIVVVVGIEVFTTRQTQISEANRKQQHDTDLQIAEKRQQGEFLQTYFDKMSELLFEKNLRHSSPGDETRYIAQARTLSALHRLDAEYTRAIIDFLFGSSLLQRTADKDIINLRYANLSGVHFQGADLHKAKLQGADLRGADLRGADLHEADLHEAKLQGADLRGAILSEAILSEAILSEAKLQGADLRGAYLHEAILSEAILSEAKLQRADLSGAILDRANLRETILSGAILQGAELSGATLQGADLSAAILRGADLFGADLGGAIATPEQLRTAKNVTTDHLAQITSPNRKV